MAAITASMVKLSCAQRTDAPMMECKKALTEADGDMLKAEEILRVKLGSKASKGGDPDHRRGLVVAVSIES
jgi:elongation factor Ts